MARGWCLFGEGLVLLLVALVGIPSSEGRFRTTQPTLVEFGTFVAGDSTCFFKRIFKGQKSPVTFTLQSATAINYVKIEMANTNIRKGGVSAQIIRGATATVSITVEITDGSLKSVFTNDIDVTMLCTPAAG